MACMIARPSSKGSGLASRRAASILRRSALAAWSRSTGAGEGFCIRSFLQLGNASFNLVYLDHLSDRGKGVNQLGPVAGIDPLSPHLAVYGRHLTAHVDSPREVALRGGGPRGTCFSADH